MQTRHTLFALTIALIGATGTASAQGPGASGAAATIPERDVRPSMGATTTAPGGMTTAEPSNTVGRSRDGNITAPRQGMTNDTMGVGTSNPQNSTSR